MQQPEPGAAPRSLSEPAALPRERLAERILRDLGERIATGELSAGELLPAEAALGGNRMLGLLLEGLREPMRKARTRSWQGRIRVGHEVQDQLTMHRRIIAAIKRHQPGAAAAAMARHLDLAEVHLRAAESDEPVGPGRGRRRSQG